MKKIVAISGTHGTGKSCLAYTLCAYLKKIGKNVVVLDELAREAPFPISQDADDRTQIWIACSQIAKELELMERYELVITDRSVIDPYCYGNTLAESNNTDGWIYSNLYEYLVEHIKKYYQRLYVLDPISFNFNIEDGVRDTDENFRDRVHDNIMELLNTANVDFKLARTEADIYTDFN
jgi:deoxyadenosine/deoxycytidine kinase